MYHLSNDSLIIGIASKGAELQSIFNNHTQLEYMWRGDPAFWGKKSPVLFPIVGGLKNNIYTYNGKPYTLNRHGFARDSEFTVAAQTNSSIEFTLASSEETLKVYPFHFHFSVIYTLDQNSVSVSYVVENTGKETMYFSVGAHPAFAVPLIEGTEFTDHYLQFSNKETAGKWPLSEEGLIETKPVPCLENTDQLPLNKELFFGDALVFKQLTSNSISILNTKNKHGLELQFTDFPYMGIWSAKNADFVCIEPWCGIADSVSASGDISKKEGIHSLEPDETFKKSWKLKVF